MHRFVPLLLLVLMLNPGCKTPQRQFSGPPPQLAPGQQARPVPFPSAAPALPVPPPPGPPARTNVVPPPPAPPTFSYFCPPGDAIVAQLGPGNSSTPLPAAPPTTQAGAQISLFPPEPEEGPSRSSSAPSLPLPLASSSPGTSIPTGIPNFTQVEQGIAAGHRPALEEGLDWLQRQGYRKVILLKLPGEDDSADRKQIEKRGMLYVALEVSPATLSPLLVQDFARLVGDRTQQPLFVYDRDGSLAGGMWFLYFRTIELLDGDAANLRALPLGYRDDLSEAHRRMWLAVQIYLSRR